MFSALFQLKNINSPSLNFIFEDLLESLNFTFLYKNRLTPVKIHCTELISG